VRDRLTDLLHSCGLTLVEHRTVGREIDGKRVSGGVATAIVKQTPIPL
jgi:hypothetical protein